jgi:hypothetical protein
MILSSISFFCNLVRAAALPSTPLPNREDYGVWREAAKVRPLPELNVIRIHTLAWQIITDPDLYI